MMKRFILGLFVLFVAAAPAAAAPAAAAERIERFISDVDVQRNGDLLVTESIQVRAEGREIKRGILRDFPTTYRRKDGSRVEVGFNVLSVTRDGRDEHFTTERMANGVRIRIGSADQFVNTGSHQYVIKYRTTRQIGFFEKFDELYWNVTGTGWTFPIDVAEARINLPERVEFTQTAFYTGPQGAQGQDATIVEKSPGRIVFRTTKPMPVANGLTVAAAWQKGVVLQPTSMQTFGAMLKDDPALLFTGIGGGGIVLFYLVAWWLIGRDPPRGTIIPLFAPPAGMSAPAVRFVHRMGFDNRGFAAAIVDLGVNGHLKLVDAGGSQELRRLNGAKPLDPAEQAVEKALFTSTGLSAVPLEQSQHKVISDAKSALMNALQAAYQGKLFRTNFGWSGIGLLMIALVTAAIGYVYYDSYGSNGGAMLAGLLVPILPIMIGAGLINGGWTDGSKLRIIIGAIVIVVAAAVGFLILSSTAGTGPAIVPAVVSWALAVLGALGFSWLEAPTAEGRRVMDQIDGFKQYLSVAEEARLDALNPPKKTPELFERFLPYAIALDVQNAWAKRFAGVLAAAGTAAAAYAWYESDRHSNDIVSFADRVGDDLSRTIASASTAPGSTSSDSSSGSSGGGSSGGGGGGGGGSGW